MRTPKQPARSSSQAYRRRSGCTTGSCCWTVIFTSELVIKLTSRFIVLTVCLKLQQLPSTSTGHVSEGDISMARQFFDAGASDVRTAGLPPNQGQMLELARRMQMNSGTAHQVQPQMQPQAGSDLQDMWMRAEMQKYSQTAQPASPSAWISEFGKTINMSTGQTNLSQGNGVQDGKFECFPPRLGLIQY